MTITDLLHQEVVPAIGCTEPIAVALCVAKAKEELGQEPEDIVVRLSKNIYKNAMAVGIPNTGMTGLPIAIALGATAGHSAYRLEVLRDADEAAVAYAKAYMERTSIRIEVAEDAPDILYIHTMVRAGEAQAAATIQGTHTHFLPPEEEAVKKHHCTNISETNTVLKTDILPSLRTVWDYAMKVNLEEVAWLQEGADMNIRAAETSFHGNYGHGLGRLLHSSTQAHLSNSQLSNCQIQSVFGDTLFTKILSYTCGACDARMSGAMVQVMSNSAPATKESLVPCLSISTPKSAVAVASRPFAR